MVVKNFFKYIKLHFYGLHNGWHNGKGIYRIENIDSNKLKNNIFKKFYAQAVALKVIRFNWWFLDFQSLHGSLGNEEFFAFEHPSFL